MSNMIAIAQKELRSYFVSPIAYVFIAFFAVLYGVFFVASLNFVVRLSMQAGMGMGGPQTININEGHDPAALWQYGRNHVARLADDDDADVCRGKAVWDDRAIAVLTADRPTDHHGKVSGCDDAVYDNAGRHLHPCGYAPSCTASRSLRRS